jgi:hypothetical protein
MPETMCWWEAASGHRRSAYFIGKILSTFMRIGLSSLHLTAFYVLLATPIMPFRDTLSGASTIPLL